LRKLTNFSAGIFVTGERRLALRVLFFSLLLFPLISVAEPPFNNTTELETITETDPSNFVNSVYEGVGERRLYDKRVEGVPELQLVHLFRAFYSDGLSVEFQVNMEFGSEEEARKEVDFIASVFGRLPLALRIGIQVVHFNKGDELFGLVAGGIILHIGLYVDAYIKQGTLEEALAHKSAHASTDPVFCNSEDWKHAQEADGKFISLYGELHPTSEDCTESFLAYIALRYRSDRISEEDIAVIEETIPHRIAFFDRIGWNMEPLTEPQSLINAGLNDAWFNPETNGQGFLITVFPDIEQMFMAWFTYEVARPDESIPAQLGEAGHRWLTAQGAYIDNHAVLDVYSTTGGVFDSPEPEPIIEKVGEIIVEFTTCNSGVIRYHIPSIGCCGLRRTFRIERIVLDNVPLCEALQDELPQK
jgi:hypothetical protein